MKKSLFARARIIVGVSSIVLLGWFAWPYYALYDFLAALQNADAVSLENRVDWDRVRQGLRADLNAVLLHHIRNERADTSSPGGALGTGIAAVLGPSLITQLVDAYVTPQAISNLIRTGRPATSTQEAADANAYATEEGKEWRQLNWNQVKFAFFSGGPATFRIEFQPDANQPIQRPVILLFKWRGDWKLARIFLPVDAIVAQQEADRRAKEQAVLREREEREQALLRERNEREQAKLQLPAQQAVLYEENPNNPQGNRFIGTAIWRTEMVSPAPGRARDMAVRADVEIPERQMTMTWALRRNTDPALPASHTIEITFDLPRDSPLGGVQNVPGVLTKQEATTRGVPLAGLAVKVMPGFFMVGLSQAPKDLEANTKLLKERSWFDVPIVYENGRRAILAFEKGATGDRAFNDVFTQWAKGMAKQ